MLLYVSLRNYKIKCFFNDEIGVCWGHVTFVNIPPRRGRGTDPYFLSQLIDDDDDSFSR